MTTVISVRGLTRVERAALEADPNFVYVGRAFAGWRPSMFGNPFKGKFAVSNFRRELTATMRYANCLIPLDGVGFNTFEIMAFNLRKLRGKKLGCWCGCWQPGLPDISCHAVVLAKLADSTLVAGPARPEGEGE